MPINFVPGDSPRFRRTSFPLPPHPRKSRRGTCCHDSGGGRTGLCRGRAHRAAVSRAIGLQCSQSGQKRRKIASGTEPGGTDARAEAAHFPGGTVRIRGAGRADAIATEASDTLSVHRAGHAGPVSTESGDALIVLLAGQAGAVAAELAGSAVGIGGAGGADPVAAQERGALTVLRAGSATAQQTEVCDALRVVGAGGADAVLADVAGWAPDRIGAADGDEGALRRAGIPGGAVESPVVALL